MTSSSPTNYVAYYRVSTEKQGKTHLGLDAQKASIHAFLKQYGGTLQGEFTEVESGRNTERTELQKAMTMAKLTGGILLVAKLDRLSRDMHFLTGLQKQGVQFRIADMPFVDPLTLHILGALAEHEAHMISERTRLALAEIKKRGLIKLGNPQLHLFRCVDTENAREARLEHLNSFDGNLSNMVSLLTAEGFETCAEICRELNRRGILRLSKTPFTPASVWQFMKKIAKKRMDSHRKAS